jgi:hypothetical protein
VADRPALRDPHPPWLEYSFYVHERPSVDGFADLVRAVLSDGAAPVEVAFYRGPNMRGRLAETLLPAWHTKPERFARPSPDDLEALLRAPDVLVIGVDVENPTGIVPEALEQIDFCRPYELEVVRAGRIPFELRVDGELFDFLSRDVLRSAGTAMYERFRRLCEAVRPDYAALAEEEFAEALVSLEAGAPASAFIDFYVREGFLGEERSRRLRALYADAFVEDWTDGFYVSAWEFGNPSGIGVADGTTRAVQAGRIIAGLQ